MSAVQNSVSSKLRYSPLSDTDIRLLDFIDDTGSRFTLQHHHLDSKPPPYIALSYRWSGEPTCSIVINDTPFQVRENLQNALKALAKQVRAEQALFWVDAICINQDDTLERNAQIKKMKDIYQSSERIFAWLGKPSNGEQTKLAIDMMSRMRVSLETAWLSGGEDISAIRNHPTVDHFAFPTTTSHVEIQDAWTGISKLLSSSYWERTWIYQEATTPQALDFFCGRHHFSALDIFPAIYFAETFKELPGDHRQMFRQIAYGCSAYCMYTARLARADGSQRKLLDLLKEIKSTNASDPRDKIYACLGHARDADKAQSIPVDYKRAVADVYIDLVSFSMSNWEVCALEFLALVCTPSPDSTSRYLRQVLDPPMPSWVPDWRQRINQSGVTAKAVDGSSLYKPCPDTMVEAKIMDRELHVKGLLSTTFEVAYLTKLWWETYSQTPFESLAKMVSSADFGVPESETDSNSQSPTESQTYMTASDSEKISQSRTKHHAEFMDITGRTVVLDRTYTPDHLRVANHNWLRTYIRGGTTDWDLVSADPKTLDLPTQIRRDTMLELMQAGLLGRRLGGTKAGHYGSFPAATQVGDRVVMFYGGGALYVLRPVEGRQDQHVFRFIGECYIDGGMDGTLMRECMVEDGSEITFRLI